MENLEGNSIFLAASRFGTLRRPFVSTNQRFTFQREFFKGFLVISSLNKSQFDPLFDFYYYEQRSKALRTSFTPTRCCSIIIVLYPMLLNSACRIAAACQHNGNRSSIPEARAATTSAADDPSVSCRAARSSRRLRRMSLRCAFHANRRTTPASHARRFEPGRGGFFIAANHASCATSSAAAAAPPRSDTLPPLSPCGRCAAAASTNDYGNCVKPVGNIGEMWSADFGFDVPAIAPPFEYDVTVTAYDGAGNSLWAVASAFYIP